MTTKEFFNLTIACGFTRNQLSIIYDALYDSMCVKRKRGQSCLADTNEELMKYVQSIIKRIDLMS